MPLTKLWQFLLFLFKNKKVLYLMLFFLEATEGASLYFFSKKCRRYANNYIKKRNKGKPVPINMLKERRVPRSEKQQQKRIRSRKTIA